MCAPNISTLAPPAPVPYQSFDETLAIVPTRNTNHHLIYPSNHIPPPFNPENISHLQLLQDPNVNYDFEQQQFASYPLGEGAPTTVDTPSVVTDQSLTRNLEFCVSGPFPLDYTPLFIQHPSSAAVPVAPPNAPVATTPAPAIPPVWSINSLLTPHSSPRTRKCSISAQELIRRVSEPEYYCLSLSQNLSPNLPQSQAIGTRTHIGSRRTWAQHCQQTQTSC